MKKRTKMFWKIDEWPLVIFDPAFANLQRAHTEAVKAYNRERITARISALKKVMRPLKSLGRQDQQIVVEALYTLYV